MHSLFIYKFLHHECMCLSKCTKVILYFTINPAIPPLHINSTNTLHLLIHLSPSDIMMLNAPAHGISVTLDDFIPARALPGSFRSSGLLYEIRPPLRPTPPSLGRSSQKRLATMAKDKEHTEMSLSYALILSVLSVHLT